jgi:DNA-binding MarR family transcriptional regulator
VVAPVDCDPGRCPCDDAACTLSRYARAAAGTASQDRWGSAVPAEEALAERLADREVDVPAVTAVTTIYRAANAVRNHLERTVLAEHDLTWTGWMVLWVVWVWGDVESRHGAAEAGISKGTLTGVVSTLMGSSLLERRVHPEDARRILLSLSPEGQRLMTEVVPRLHAAEVQMTAQLSGTDLLALARSLRSVVKQADSC